MYIMNLGTHQYAGVLQDYCGDHSQLVPAGGRVTHSHESGEALCERMGNGHGGSERRMPAPHAQGRAMAA